MRPPTLPVYEGCWYHGSEDGAGAAIPHGVIPHTIRANLFSSSQIETGFLIQCHADGVEKTFVKSPPRCFRAAPRSSLVTLYFPHTADKAANNNVLCISVRRQFLESLPGEGKKR